MKSCEVITDAYDNEVTAWNDLTDYLYTMWPSVKVK
jgi:hypothetical protein